MREIISGMKISVDGYIEDSEGKLDWVENWEEDYGLLDRVDACVLGRVMYPGYGAYWTAALDHPKRMLPFTGKLPTPGEIEYAKWTSRTPHIVVSSKPLDVQWKHTRVISDLEEIRTLKQKPGKDIYLVGGATLVSSMMNLGLIDEIRLIVNPVLLGGGKALFKDVSARHHLKLESARQVDSGQVSVNYRVQ